MMYKTAKVMPLRNSRMRQDCAGEQKGIYLPKKQSSLILGRSGGLGERALSMRPGDPRVTLLDAEALRAEAHLVEAVAIKRALVLSGWLIKPAAARLGMALSTLTSKLRAAHRPLLREVEVQRKARGYTRGNPTRRKPR